MSHALSWLRGLCRFPRHGLLLLIVLAAAGYVCWFAGRQAWAEYHFRTATRLLGENRPAQALEHLQDTLRVWPHGFQTHLLAGRAARLTEAFDDAGEHLQECQQQDQESEPVLLEWAMLRAQRGEVADVDEYLKKLVANNHPDTLLILQALTTGYLRMYRWSGAMQCLRIWLDRDPDSVQALIYRGQAWRRVHEHQLALDDHRRALELDPDNEEARSAFVDSLLDSKQPAEAAQSLEVLLHRQPDNLAFQVKLARCRNELGQSAEAAVALDGILTVHPEYVPALTERGKVAIDQGNFDDAERWLRKSLAHKPSDQYTNLLLHQCLLQARKTEAAKVQEAKLRDIENALKRLIEIGNKDMSLRPRDPALHCELGTIFFQLGQDDLGVRWMQSALQQNPSFRPAHQALADHYQHVGDHDRAAYHRQQAASF